MPSEQPRRRRSPLETVRRARRGIGAARADDVFLYSAALAFYGLISVAPLVVVALWVTTLLVGEAQVQHVAENLARLAPPALGVDGALERVADLETTLGLLAVVAALWPATAYGSALARVLDRVAGDRVATGLRGRGAALLLVFIVPALVLGSLVAGYAGAVALGDTAVEVAIGLALALVLSFTATVATVVVIYKAFPRTPPGWRATLRGAVVAAGGIASLSVAYVAYLRLAPTSSSGTRPMRSLPYCYSLSGCSPPTPPCSSATELPGARPGRSTRSAMACAGPAGAGRTVGRSRG